MCASQYRYCAHALCYCAESLFVSRFCDSEAALPPFMRWEKVHPTDPCYCLNGDWQADLNFSLLVIFFFFLGPEGRRILQQKCLQGQFVHAVALMKIMIEKHRMHLEIIAIITVVIVMMMIRNNAFQL